MMKLQDVLLKAMAKTTNNAAERALRCAVQWRKISFGSRSPQGEVAVARLLTVARTCRMQNRSSLAYLGHAIRSHRKAQPGPSLLKTAAECRPSRRKNSGMSVGLGLPVCRR